MALELWTLDVGNSSAKLRCWGASQASDGRRVLRRAELTGELRGQFEPAAPLAGLSAALDRALGARTSGGASVLLALSCVASLALQEELAARLACHSGVETLVNPDPGLANDASPPESVGRDRLYAARGAFERLGASAIVVDVGSALTVDLMLVDREDGRARPRFAGGAIAPGPALLARALHEHTARLPLVEVRPGVAALGRSTAAAIESGVFHGLRGAAAELVQRLASQAPGAALELVVTGGAARWLLEPELFQGRAPLHEPDLVHLGLAHAALDARAQRAAPRGGA